MKPSNNNHFYNYGRMYLIVVVSVILIPLISSLLFFEDQTKVLMFGLCEKTVFDNFCQSETLRKIIGSFIWGLCFLPLSLFLEIFIPANDKQPLLSIGLKQDVLWFLLRPVFKFTLVIGFANLIYMLYVDHLAFLRISYLTGLDLHVQIIVVIVLSDLVSWFSHFVKHKVPFFWEFHALHHSQKELNYFSDWRFHPIESLFSKVITFIPFYSLELDTAVPVYLAWELFTNGYTRFYHANIRLNLGVFRYVFVTPQSHRVHHSSKIEHQDTNFGLIFSIWDFLFGTQYRVYDEYPNTGVNDTGFPLEHGGSLIGYLKVFCLQLIYPFKRVFSTQH